MRLKEIEWQAPDMGCKNSHLSLDEECLEQRYLAGRFCLLIQKLVHMKIPSLEREGGMV